MSQKPIEPIEQMKLPAYRTFFGVGTLHPKVSLMMEMRELPVVCRHFSSKTKWLPLSNGLYM